MENKRRLLLVCLGIVWLLALWGCGRFQKQAVEDLGPRVWLDAPLDERVIRLEPYPVVMHGSHLAGVRAFELLLDGARVAEVPAEEVSPGLSRGEQSWLPPGPGEYTLAVRAQASFGVWGPTAQAVVRVLGDDLAVVESESLPASGTPTPVPPAPTPSSEPTTLTNTPRPSTLTPTGVCNLAVALEITEKLFCRKGSSPSFPAAGSFVKGERALVQAFNPSMTWAYVNNPMSPGDFCWVWMNYTEIGQGDPDCVAIRPDPPTPTPSLTPTEDVSATPDGTNTP